MGPSAAAAFLLALHAAIIGFALPRNAVTIDEVVHLPAGLSYWHFGQFSCYHHNPPLIKLAFSLPALVARVPTDYRNYQYIHRSRFPDDLLGQDFMMANRDHYMDIYCKCRSVVIAISVLGGYLVFRWSREMFGALGGLISLMLWVFCPEVLAHSGLVTIDMGATVAALGACYGFRRYLRNPTFEKSLLCGGLLGVAEASKFSLVVLPVAWIALVAVARWSRRLGNAMGAMSARRLVGHAMIVCITSLYVLNTIYLFEGTGRTLGSFDFQSRMLTARGKINHNAPKPQGNRFRHSFLGHLPVPLPEHYVLGFDDQMSDVDSGSYYKYLCGELREDGWYWYYLYYFAVKTPVGMIGLMVAAALIAATRRDSRGDLLDEASLMVPAGILFFAVSSQTGLNFGRYAIPVYPYLFILAGRLGPFLSAGRGLWSIVVTGTMTWTVVGVLSVYPNFLAYFNEAVGGPEHGLEHLADSNIDWGQGLIDLKEWLEKHAQGRTLRLAYFGNMLPEILGIRYELPPFGVEDDASDGHSIQGPVPGLQAVSANYVIGIPLKAPNGRGSQTLGPSNSSGPVLSVKAAPL